MKEFIVAILRESLPEAIGSLASAILFSLLVWLLIDIPRPFAMVIVVVVLYLLCVGLTIYVFVSKKKSSIDDSKHLPRFNRIYRPVAAVSLFTVTVMLIFVFIPRPLPKADPNRFAVGIAHLDNDKDGQFERLVLEALNDLTGIQVLRFDRTISVESFDPEKAVSSGHEKARDYLRSAKADVLIWGFVLSVAGRSLPKLYLTSSIREYQGSGKRYQPTEDLGLPVVFWEDLADVLKLVLVSYQAELLVPSGRIIAEELKSFVQKVRALLQAPEHKGWNQRSRALVKFILADSISAYGELVAEDGALREAATIYFEVLEEFNRERLPFLWAATQHNLGTTLFRIGQRESGTSRLEEALLAYREALKERTRERVPLDWAMTQSNVANTLFRIGERESGTSRLKEGVEAYQETLKEWRREHVPLNWATTHNNLCSGLTILAERESGTVTLREAVAACREALKEWTRERVPLDWAMAQNNLGTALVYLGERESGTSSLTEAVGAYREALKEWTRERVPLGWAQAQSNLGVALAAIAEREPATERLEAAVTAYREALKEQTRERAPWEWARTQHNLGNALAMFGEREAGTVRLEEAVEAFKQALKERTPERSPLQWSYTQHQLGNTLRKIGERANNGELICQALGYHVAVSKLASTGVALRDSLSKTMSGEIERDILVLRQKMSEQKFQQCLKQHDLRLLRIN